VKCIIYSCPFVPPEWIAAHGLHPRRATPGGHAKPGGAGGPRADGGVGVCPYARAFLVEATDPAADGVVFTTVCDQMRRISERVERESTTFLMHVPATWRKPAHRFYQEELRRLGRFLVRLGGCTPTEGGLREVMQRYDAGRRRLLDGRPRQTAREFAEAMHHLHAHGPSEPVTGKKEPGVTGSGGIRLALVGGPLPRDDFAVLDVIEMHGGAVVLDATQNGERTLPAHFDRQRLRDDPFGELADAYFGCIPDAFRRPNSALYQWLKREFIAREVQGIVFRRYVWCDTWHAEAQRMAEWAGVPLLALDVEDGYGTDTRTASRIQAFLEALR
jgi:benzoyl-CoA reductase/2-hydroxyglutaryl-CoA dehydratase subunit BcrC/BadD/HgdB